MISDEKLTTWNDVEIEIERFTEKLQSLIKISKASTLKLDSELKKVSDGTRVSARTFDQYDADQLRPLVSTLFEELQSCKEQLSNITSSVESELGYWSRHPTFLPEIYSYINSNNIMLNLDKQMTRIEQSNIDLTAQFKCQIAGLEQLKSTVTSQPPPFTPAEFQQCHAAQLKELEGLTTAIKAQPKPSPPVLDYSKIKFPPLPSPPPATKQVNMPTPATIRKEIRISQDAERRQCNVILRGLRCDPETDPTVATKSFLKSCNIENYNLYQNDLVTAHFLNRRDDYCTIRVVFSNHWTAENILNSAHQLKKCSTKLYQTVYLAKDRTEEEMKYHRKLVSELKSKIKAHPTTRWVIQNEEIVNKGQYC